MDSRLANHFNFSLGSQMNFAQMLQAVHSTPKKLNGNQLHAQQRIDENNLRYQTAFAGRTLSTRDAIKAIGIKYPSMLYEMLKQGRVERVETKGKAALWRWKE
jgi:hypothetical protein